MHTTNFWPIVLVIIATPISAVIVRFVLKHSVGLGLLQHPNERSSHEHPTPAGGGVGIFIAASLCILLLYPLNLKGYSLIFQLLFLALPFAIMGWLDDTRGMSSAVRFLIQIILLITFALSLRSYSIAYWMQEHSAWYDWFLALATVFCGVWWVNLYNFMDGIDGQACLQGIFMLLAACLLAASTSAMISSFAWWWAALILAAALIGFLCFNWAPAKIFMGDAGSTWLAFIIFVLAVSSLQLQILNAAVWIILGAVFIVDASITLIVRIVTGQKFYAAHRSHVFQHLTNRFSNRTQSHRTVCALYGAVNIIWLLPLAYLALKFPNYTIGLVFIAYIPLVISAFYLGAGRPMKTKP